MNIEIWKDVLGYENIYQVSNNGHIRSLLSNKNLKPRISHRGYFLVWLSIRVKRKHVSLHRLIADAFIPNPENKPTVNHKDGNKLNNSVENLEWATHIEQAHHARDNKLTRGRKADGNHLSQEVISRLRESSRISNKTKISIICTNTGEIFSSISECTRKADVVRATLKKYIKSGQPIKGNIYKEYTL